MNQYHIYDKLGRSRNSTVYKGRKKKGIQYFAIKSVDKTQKQRVLQEVGVFYKMSPTFDLVVAYTMSRQTRTTLMWQEVLDPFILVNS